MSNPRTPEADSSKPVEQKEDSLAAKIGKSAVSGAISGVVLTPINMAARQGQISGHLLSKTLIYNVAYSMWKKPLTLTTKCATVGAQKNMVANRREDAQERVKGDPQKPPYFLRDIVGTSIGLQMIDTTFTGYHSNVANIEFNRSLLAKKGIIIEEIDRSSAGVKFNLWKAGFGFRTLKGSQTLIGLMLQPCLSEYTDSRVAVSFGTGLVSTPLIVVADIIGNKQLETVTKMGTVDSFGKLVMDAKGVWPLIRGQSLAKGPIIPTCLWTFAVQTAIQYVVPASDKFVDGTVTHVSNTKRSHSESRALLFNASSSASLDKAEPASAAKPVTSEPDQDKTPKVQQKR